MEDMQRLVDRLNETAYAYYVLDNPLITDAQWDALYDKLVKLEEQTGERLPDSPTRRVGGDILPGFEPHRHIRRLWSLGKAQTPQALQEWAQRCEKGVAQEANLPPLRYAVEYKFDGLSINLTYREGLLVQAATRGNGEVGEAILEQVRTIRAIPLRIPFQGLMEVQGECIMRLSAFEAYNRTAAEPLKNPRNGAAGALRNLDPKVTASRRLDAFFYQVGYVEGMALENAAQMMAFLRDNGFSVTPLCEEFDSIQGVQACIEGIEGQREKLDYLIDGAVVKLCDFGTRDALGYTDKFPRWALAYKFEAEETTTRLLDVTWEPGRTGKLTPLAHLEPVELAGVTVARATLNNWGDIQRKGVSIGAEVWVRRSNDVIPEIMGCVEGSGAQTTAIDMPTQCPACGTALVERGAHLFCPNTRGCKPQAVARLSHFASRGAMDIEMFSEKTASLFYDELGLREPGDLYSLPREQMVSLKGFGDKKADKLLDELEKSKTPELGAFLFALGISNIGAKTARDLAARFGSLEALMAADEGALLSVPEVGKVVAESVLGFFAEADNREQVDRLVAAGIVPRPVKPQLEGAFAGKTFVLTGTLPSLSRGQAEAMIVGQGGKASSSVSKNTNYVLAGESAGSKLEKAQKLGIAILDEAAFLAMLPGGGEA